MNADIMITSLTPLFATFHPPREPCNKLMKNMTTENIGNKSELRYNIYAVQNALKKAHILLFYFQTEGRTNVRNEEVNNSQITGGYPSVSRHSQHRAKMF
jgi:hypothetical protein